MRHLFCITFIFSLLCGYVYTQELTIGNYTLAGKGRVSRTEFEFTYTADITNTGGDFRNVTASVTSSSLNTVVVVGNLTFGDVPSGATVTSTNTFTIRQNRLFPFNVADLTWDIQATPSVTVPNVLGLSQADAEAAIIAADLTVGAITTANSDTVPAGDVISQDPAGGASVAQGTTVDLVVSLGSVPGVVPDVAGLSQGAAEAAITGANFTVGTVTTAHSAIVLADNVISQNPQGGATALHGSAVDLVVSVGPWTEDDPPPDPATVAPEPDRSVVTALATATEFLYAGPNPIQTDVAPGTIEDRRAAVLRGKVMHTDGSPLPGVSITILNHTEYGTTITRADGMFDMAVNGGGQLTVNYAKNDFIPAQRQVSVPWQDYASLPDVVMIPYDDQVTTIDLSAQVDFQVAQSSVVTDDVGTRQVTLLFSQGTQAELVSPDGATLPLNTLNVRATEYTVGDSGPKAMPAELPPNSAYTYAVELSADEAGAMAVQFDRPVIFYVDDFLHAEVGSTVPMGYYDRGKAAWVPSDSGRVVEVLSIDNGIAELDVDGSAQPADAQELADLGVADAERQRLALLYQPGQSLWRVPITHFSPWDCNWGWGPPDDAEWPGQRDPDNYNPLDDSCKTPGSIIESQNQILGEAVDVIGTPFQLHYQSDRVPGRVAGLEIPLSGSTVPDSLVGIDLEVHVAGRLFTHSLRRAHECLDNLPALGAANVSLTRSVATQETVENLTDQSYTFVWDGKDAYNRDLRGQQPVTVRIGYVYCGAYQYTNRFGYNGGGMISGSRTRQEAILWQEWKGKIGSIGVWDAHGQSLGAWSLNVHHAYDYGARVLYIGDGGRRSATGVNRIIDTVAGNGRDAVGGYGGPAVDAPMHPWRIAVAPDGGFYVTQEYGHAVDRVDPDGIITRAAGTGSFGYSGDGGPATQARLYDPIDVAVGPDGSFYIADRYNSRIRKVSPSGIITTVAGTGVSGYSGDGGPATEADLREPIAVAVGSDGTIYIACLTDHRVRRVGPDGIITTVAGTGVEGYTGDGGPATEAQVGNPLSLAIGPDGSLYIGSSRPWVSSIIRRVSPDGIITTVAGGGDPPDGVGDGGPATDAYLSSPWDVAAGPDGSLYITDYGKDQVLGLGPRIRWVRSNGIITTVAGTGQARSSGDGGLATQAEIKSPKGLDLCPDGSLLIVDYLRVRQVRSALPGISSSDTVIPSDDGDELYEFSALGRHMRTLDALTGAVIYSFGYDSAGHLVQVEDGDGNITTIERDANGDPTAIIAPFGQRTELSLDANGYLASITNPASESVQMTYSSDGLLQTLTDPKGATYRFTYDALGRLTNDEDPAGGSKTLARADMDNGYEITVETALNRATAYRVERLSTGGQRRVNTFPDDTQNETVIGTDGSTTTTLSDGTVVTSLEGPDPRFGMQAPFLKSQTITTPSGLSYIETAERSAVLTDPTDFLSITSITDTLTVNGNVYTSVYDGPTRTLTHTTPEGRVSITTLDDQGRLSYMQENGLAPKSFSYDARGRLSTISEGTGAEARTTALTYDSDGRLDSITDPIGRRVNFTYDEAGRVTSQTSPDGGLTQLSYDAKGNLMSITPPGQPVHTFAVTPVDLLSVYTSPDVGAGSNQTTYAHNADGQKIRKTLPGGKSIDYTYDGAGGCNCGRLASKSLPRGQFVYDYSAATGQLTSITTPDGGTLSFSYDGALVTSQTWTGTVAGSVEYSYDNDFRLISTSVNGSDTIALQYDNDGLLVQAGNLMLNRNADNGLLAGTVLDKITDIRSYDSFAEPASYSAAYNGTDIFTIQYTYDKLGRITQKIETIDGQTDTYNYTYTLAGHLAEVTKNGSTIAAYTYSANGNRLSYAGAGGSVNGTYDGQDRLLQYGSANYTYSANGELLSKTIGGETTTYHYDAMGNLMSVNLPDDTQIDYIVDGNNRRIGKKVNGALVQGFLYRDQINPIAELDGSGSLVSRFVYVDGTNVPAYMVKRGVTYRIISDHRDSPRLVINASTGEVVQRVDYDEFGNVLQDTNPGFQPFGFAGGFYDQHTELLRFGARDYDAVTGRWTLKDPIRFSGGDSNLYRYVFNDPVNSLDPLGLSDLCDQMLNILKRRRSLLRFYCTDDCEQTGGGEKCAVGKYFRGLDKRLGEKSPSWKGVSTETCIAMCEKDVSLQEESDIERYRKCKRAIKRNPRYWKKILRRWLKNQRKP